jgi:GAF domain-containing protein
LPSHAPLLIVPDARQDERFAQLPLVVGDVGLRFYAEAPVLVDCEVVGSLCVIDTTPRTLTPGQCESLQELAALAASLLIQGRQRREADDHAQRLHDLARASGDWMWELDAQGRYTWISGSVQAATGVHPRELLGSPLPPELLVDEKASS